MNRKNIIIISILIILISGGLLYPKMQLKYYRDCRKRSIPTHSERLNPSSFTAKLALKSA